MNSAKLSEWYDMPQWYNIMTQTGRSGPCKVLHKSKPRMNAGCAKCIAASTRHYEGVDTVLAAHQQKKQSLFMTGCNIVTLHIVVSGWLAVQVCQLPCLMCHL